MSDRRLTTLLRLPLLCAALYTGFASVRAAELQDPTRPAYLDAGRGPSGNEGKGSSGLVLNAIRLSPTQRSAMINDRSVKVGASVGTARVVAIDRDGVRLQRGTERFTLQLLPIEVKQAHKAARR